jgi:fatty-acyl-CoA synthase
MTIFTEPTLTRHIIELWRRKPEIPAVHLIDQSKPDQAISRKHMYRRSSVYAQALEDSDILPGEVVIIILNHGTELIFAFWGAVLHGAIPAIMPFLTEKLSPEQYRKSLVSLLEISKPAAIITFPEFIPEVDLALQPLQPDGRSVRAVLNSNDISNRTPPSTFHFHGLERMPGDIALLQHSSGTTGLQKGVALSHQAVFNQLESYAAALALKDNDVIVSWLPLYHDMGLIAGFILPILFGLPLVIMSPFDWVRSPRLLFQAVSKYHGTLSWLPNFAFNFCAQKIRPRDLQDVDLSSWRAVINCSEPMFLKSHHLFADRFANYGLRSESLATCYAMAENVFAVTQGGIKSPVVVDRIDPSIFLNERKAYPVSAEQPSLSMLSAGKPIDNVEVRILADDLSPLADRLVGQIAIRSNSMLNEYYHRPELTQKAFLEGWYLTGDLGYTVDGEVFITGRIKDMMIVGGKNIYPQDLENLASEISGIHPGRVAAFGVMNEDSGTEDIVLVAEVDEESLSETNTHDQIANAVRIKINQGSDISLRFVKLVPRGWLIKTSSGKIARAANKEKYLAEWQSLMDQPSGARQDQNR